MKKTFSERVSSFLKSFGSPDEGEGKNKKKKKGEENEEGANVEDINLELGDPDDGDDDDDDDMEKSYADVTEIMTALVDELKGINKSLDALTKRNEGIEKSQEDFGESIVQVAEMLAKIGSQPNPVKTVLTKSLQANNGAGSVGGNSILTRPEFERAQKALVKSFEKKEITLFESSRLECEMQKAMTIAGYQMKSEDRAAIAGVLATA
ncbi:hypothetical protein FACS1894151_10110 [Spirochaetia bacterium]|nr:hypothetical protein FACS1894151_10110 [Spirochaetia bacterium]